MVMRGEAEPDDLGMILPQLRHGLAFFKMKGYCYLHLNLNGGGAHVHVHAHHHHPLFVCGLWLKLFGVQNIKENVNSVESREVKFKPMLINSVKIRSVNGSSMLLPII